MKKRIFLILACINLCTGCQSHRTENLETLQNLSGTSLNEEAHADQTSNGQSAPQFVNAQLSDTARTVQHSMQRLAEIQTATHPNVQMPAPINANSIDMAQKASVNWTGPVEPLLEKIASASHYRLRCLGNAPAIPTLINLDVKEQSLAYIVRNIGYQIRQSANITVYPKQKMIELRYANN